MKIDLIHRYAFSWTRGIDESHGRICVLGQRTYSRVQLIGSACVVHGSNV